MQDNYNVVMFFILIIFFCLFGRIVCTLQEPEDGSDLIYNEEISINNIIVQD